MLASRSLDRRTNPIANRKRIRQWTEQGVSGQYILVGCGCESRADYGRITFLDYGSLDSPMAWLTARLPGSILEVS